MKLVISLGTFVALGMATAANAQRTEQPPAPRMDQMTRTENLRQYDDYHSQGMNSGFSALGYNLTKAEEKRLSALKVTIARKPEAAVEDLRKAREKAETADGKFVVAALQIELGRKLKNVEMQREGTDLAIESGAPTNAVLAQLLQNQAVFALEANNLIKAEQAFGRLTQISPADSDTLVNLAQVKSDLGKKAEATALFDRAIAQKKATGQPVPETWAQAAESARKMGTAKP